MANIKITALPAYADPASTDVLPIVDVGADVTKKVSIENLLKNASSGTAGAPGIAFDGDNTGTGIYHPGSGQVAISTNGTGRLFIDSSGNVGIGAANSLSELLVAGSNPSIYIKPNADTETSELVFRNAANAQSRGFINYNHSDESMAFRVNLSERMRLDSSGRLGLGTSSPSSLLEIRGTNADGQLTISNSSGTITTGNTLGTIFFKNYDVSVNYNTFTGNVASIAAIAESDYASSNGARAGIAFSTNDITRPSVSGGPTLVERMRLDSQGRLGVGTTSPSYQLTVEGSTPYLQLKNTGTNTGSSRLIFGDADTASPGQLIYDHTDNSLQSVVNGSERVRIDSSGRLLVGTSTSTSVAGSAAAVQISGTGGNPHSLQLTRTDAPILSFGKTSSASGSTLGAILFAGDDTSDLNSVGARITAEIDGTIGVDDLPSRLVFSVTADGASSPTEALRITNDRYVRLASGSGGIQFNGDTAAANALDDYEEGTWSVALTGVTGSNFVGAEYVKVGNLVHLKFSRVSTGAQTFTAGDPVEITGWPFSAAQKAGNTATTCVNVANQNASWAAVNQGIKMFNMVFEQGGNTARLYNMSTGAVVTYGDLYLNPTSTNPAIRGYVVVNVA